jgi:hypothetical protein
VVVLVYGAMSGAREGGQLLSAVAASALFLLLSGAPVAAWAALAPAELRVTGALVIELRDFAVAAALATQAFGPPAATVAGVYGVAHAAGRRRGRAAPARVDHVGAAGGTGGAAGCSRVVADAPVSSGDRSV